jgi:hypothetical protein
MALVIFTLGKSVQAQTPIFHYTSKNGLLVKDAVKKAKDTSHKKRVLFSEDTLNTFNIFKNPSDISILNAYLYNQGSVSGFQSLTVQNFNGVHTDINAEFASFLFGPVRLGVSGSFQTTGDTTKDDAIKSNLQKIISNGGTINLNFLIPIFFTRTPNEQVHFGVLGQFYNGLTPGIDDNGTVDYSKSISFTNQTGLIIHFDVGSNDKKARLTFDIPCFYSASSNNVNQQIGLPNFFLARLQVGAVLGDLVNLHIAGPIYSTSTKVQHSPFLLSLQFSPSQIIGATSN